MVQGPMVTYSAPAYFLGFSSTLVKRKQRNVDVLEWVQRGISKVSTTYFFILQHSEPFLKKKNTLSDNPFTIS